MARDPGSVWAPLPEAGAPDGYVKTQFIVHSTGDNGLARSVRDNWFARGDVVVESTFIVGWGPSRNDPTLQIMDSTDNADANGSANQRGISIEVVGDGVGPFTDWQVRELVRLGLWVRRVHGILPRVIPSESAGGFGWHVMFGAPGPWTSSVGKVCPGKTRIAQLKSDIFPAIFAGNDLEDDMAGEGPEILRIVKRLQVDPGTGYGPDRLRDIYYQQQKIAASQAAQLAALTEAVKQLGGGAGVDLEAIEDAGRRGAETALERLRITVSTDDEPVA